MLSISPISTLHRVTVRKHLKSLVSNALNTEAHLLHGQPKYGAAPCNTIVGDDGEQCQK